RGWGPVGRAPGAGQARSVDREKREGLVNGERFGGCELDAVEGGARNRGRNRGERLGGGDRGVGGTGQMNTSGLETSRAVEMRDEAGLRGVLGTAEVDEAGVGDDPYAERHEPVYVVGRNQPAVFDAKPRDGAFAGETRLGGFDRGDCLFQFFDFGRMKGAIESAVERLTHGAREAGRVVLIAGHELDGGQPDSSGARKLFASIDGVEMLPADHHADALAY